jgi:asparagine N-glycosylation enzyme membrane subunit Stt3
MGSSGSGGGGGSSAGGNTLMSIGLSAYSTMLSAQGTASADEFQAAKLENAAKYGELKAVQTGGQMTRSLNTTLGNIDAVRAAANTDPNSPTGIAMRDYAEQTGTDQKTTTVNSILAQSLQQKNDAAYYRSAASDALFAGEISTAAGIAKGIAGLGMPSG